MRITDLLKPESTNLEAHAQTKKQALDMLVDLMAKQGNITDIETYRQCVYHRE